MMKCFGMFALPSIMLSGLVKYRNPLQYLEDLFFDWINSWIVFSLPFSLFCLSGTPINEVLDILAWSSNILFFSPSCYLFLLLSVLFLHFYHLSQILYFLFQFLYFDTHSCSLFIALCSHFMDIISSLLSLRIWIMLFFDTFSSHIVLFLLICLILILSFILEVFLKCLVILGLLCLKMSLQNVTGNSVCLLGKGLFTGICFIWHAYHF